MASHITTAEQGLPPDLFDETTLISLASTVAILLVAYGTSLKALSPSTPGSYRFLFIWHAFDALIHFILEGSFLYHVSPASPPHLRAAPATPARELGQAPACLPQRQLPRAEQVLTRPPCARSVSSAGSPTTRSPWARCAGPTPPPAAGSDTTTASGARRPAATTSSPSCGVCTRAPTADGPARIRCVPYLDDTNDTAESGRLNVGRFAD